MEAIDITGNVYGRLTVVGPFGKKKNHKTWLCKCICGNNTIATVFSLRSGNTKSCGCIRIEKLVARTITHGQSRDHKRTKEIEAWRGIRKRILDKNQPGYPDYGGRGIKLLYKSFEEFLEDVGPAPSPQHSIDRIEVNGHYQPGNCRWATRVTQMNNTRRTVHVTYMGETKPLTLLCRELNMRYGTVVQRIVKLKWPIEKAFTQKIKKIIA